MLALSSIAQTRKFDVPQSTAIQLGAWAGMPE